MSKPRRAHGAERCTVRNPGPHGARCRYQAGHDPVDDGVNGHAPELDDVTKADGSPVDFAPVGPIELRAALREERAARLKAEAERDESQTCLYDATDRLGEALALLSKARERLANFGDPQTATGFTFAVASLRADLAKILGTGETP